MSIAFTAPSGCDDNPFVNRVRLSRPLTPLLQFDRSLPGRSESVPPDFMPLNTRQEEFLESVSACAQLSLVPGESANGRESTPAHMFHSRFTHNAPSESKRNAPSEDTSAADDDYYGADRSKALKINDTKDVVDRVFCGYYDDCAPEERRLFPAKVTGFNRSVLLGESRIFSRPPSRGYTSQSKCFITAPTPPIVDGTDSTAFSAPLNPFFQYQERGRFDGAAAASRSLLTPPFRTSTPRPPSSIMGRSASALGSFPEDGFRSSSPLSRSARSASALGSLGGDGARSFSRLSKSGRSGSAFGSFAEDDNAMSEDEI